MTSPFHAHIAEQIWDAKYRFKEADGTSIDQTVEDTWRRIAEALASAEGDNLAPMVEEQFYEALEDFRFLPAGRITAGAGTGRMVTLFNCYVMGTIPDSLNGIFDMLKEAALTMQQGGGIGYDFSTLRPKGALVKKLGADASGPLSFMDCWDAMCRTIMSAGSRRGAMMGTMRCDHPDIRDFITAKQDSARLRMFNLSVLVTDDFMKAVEDNADWSLQFDGKVYEVTKARELWDLIMKSTYDYAEPGVIFIDRINKDNNLRYCETIAATNPCFAGSEQIMTADGLMTFAELEGQTVSVLTENQAGKLIYRPMHVFKTAKNQSLVRVVLNDGTEIFCTPNHEFFDLDRNRIQAKDMVVGQRLASVYRHNANSKGYKRLTNGIDNPLEHHVPFEIIPEGFHVHHKNEIKNDNRHSNLELIKGSVHNSMHMQGDQNPSITHPESNWLIQQDHSGENNGRYRDDISDDQLQEMRKNGMSYKAIAEAVGCSKYTVMNRLGYERPNHKVISVEPVVERQDVYCGTVEETGKFFLSCDRGGVLVSNCGEQPLPPYGACLLGSVNMAKMVDHPFEKNASLNVPLLKETVARAVRMMDNVVDVSNFPLPQQQQEAYDKRRLGLGMTGVADMLIMLGITYGSDEAVAIMDKIAREIALSAYWASVELAKEKGPFPKFEADGYLASGTFAQRLCEYDPDLEKAIRKHGIRNSHLTSIAPTGTISLYAGNVSSGIEPVFAYEYTRKVLQKDGSKTEELVQDYAVKAYWDWFGEGGSEHPDDLPDYFVSAQTLPPAAHLKMQAAAQKWVDSSISKTINLPEDISFEDFKEVYWRAYEMGCKGCTTYRPNDVTGSVLSVEPKKKEEAVSPLVEADYAEIEMRVLAQMEPTPRPDTLDGSTYKLKYGMDSVYITITDIEENGQVRPFEVFINSKNIEHFAWTIGMARMISAIFRRPHDSRFVVQELKEVFDPKGGQFMKGKYIPSMLAAIGGIIERHMMRIGYIEDKEVSTTKLTADEPPVMGLVKAPKACPNCHGYSFKVESGCEVCVDCGHSKCG